MATKVTLESLGQPAVVKFDATLKKLIDTFEKAEAELKQMGQVSSKNIKRIDTLTKELTATERKKIQADKELEQSFKKLEARKIKRFNQDVKQKQLNRKLLRDSKLEGKSQEELERKYKALGIIRKRQSQLTKEQRLEHKKLTTQYKKTGRELDKLKGKTNSFGKTLGGLKLGMIALVAGIIAIGRAVGKTVKAYDIQAKAETKLLVALKGRRDVQKVLIKQAQELQKTTLFGDEKTIEAQAMLATLIQDEEAIRRLTPLIQDLATAKGMDLVAAADLVAKSVGSSTNALSRYGIVIEGAVGSQERLNSAVNALSNQFKGQAEAAAKAGAGGITQLKNVWGDLTEVIGQVITHFGKIFGNNAGLINGINKISNGIITIVNKMIMFDNETKVISTAFMTLGATIRLNFRIIGTFFRGVTALAKGAAKAVRAIFTKDMSVKDEINATFKAFKTELEIAFINTRADVKKIVQNAQKRDPIPLIGEEDAIATTKKAEEIGEEAVRAFAKGIEKGTITAETAVVDMTTLLKKSSDEWVKDATLTDEELLEKRVENLNRFQQASNSVFSSITNFRMAAFNRELKAAEGNEAEQDRIRRKFAKKQQKADTIQAIINTAVAVTKALATLPPPFSFITAGLTGLAGASEIALIQSQQFKEGTESVQLKGNPDGVDTVPSLLTKDEGVMKVNTNKKRRKLGVKMDDVPKYIEKGLMYEQMANLNRHAGEPINDVSFAMMESKIDGTTNAVWNLQQYFTNNHKKMIFKEGVMYELIGDNKLIKIT